MSDLGAQSRKRDYSYLLPWLICSEQHCCIVASCQLGPRYRLSVEIAESALCIEAVLKHFEEDLLRICRVKR